MKHIFSIYIFIISSFGSFAQQIENFTLTDSRDGNEVSLNDFSDSKGVVVIFTSNVCPYSVYYEGRITQLVSDFKGRGVQFLLVNSHIEAKESQDEMANKLSTWGLGIPYLADKQQKILNLFGARKSPEAFVLSKKSGAFEVFYKGAIDNNPQVASDVKDQYLRQNIEAILSGKPASSGGRPIGCTIKRG